MLFKASVFLKGLRFMQRCFPQLKPWSRREWIKLKLVFMSTLIYGEVETYVDIRIESCVSTVSRRGLAIIVEVRSAIAIETMPAPHVAEELIEKARIIVFWTK